jgi:riboflavin kinase/FMN adenylyltransferase
MKTSAALGMFDGVHHGHNAVLDAALLYDKDLTPAVFTFKTLPNREHIMPYQSKFEFLKRRFKLVYSCDFGCVKDLSPEEFVRDILATKLNCAHVACGYDFRFAKNASADVNDLRRLCSEHGIAVTVVEPVMIGGEPVSSTRIRDAIRRGDTVAASHLLGRDFSYRLEVVEGAKLGRKLGTPTINQVIPPYCVLPKFGVYKSVVIVEGKGRDAITNVGIKPTVSGVQTPLIETHIPGFSHDLYGQTIEVMLYDFIRGERKFASLDDLKSQIHTDLKEIQNNG